jgi:hypothetical protein
MRYLKLYEKWLNEATELKFDLMKPDVFPITKLTQGNLYGFKPKDTEIVLRSILSKSFNSVETTEVPLNTINVTGFFHIVEFKNGGLILTNEKMVNREFLVKLPEKTREDVETEFKKIPLNIDDKEARVYLVRPSSINDSMVFWKASEAEGISTMYASIIILPPKPTNIQGFAVDAPAILINYGIPYYVTLGQIVTFASKKFSRESAVNLRYPELGKREYLVANVFKSDKVVVGGPKV